MGCGAGSNVASFPVLTMEPVQIMQHKEEIGSGDMAHTGQSANVACTLYTWELPKFQHIGEDRRRGWLGRERQRQSQWIQSLAYQSFSFLEEAEGSRTEPSPLSLKQILSSQPDNSSCCSICF